MGSVDRAFASELRDQFGLQRAVETGTYLGETSRKLADIFPSVVTIELSDELHRQASEALADLTSVRPVQGHSVDVLGELRTGESLPTLYYLDGHGSGGVTDGADDECPVLREVSVIGPGHPDDCIVIDDARLFTAPPPAPHDPAAWPTLLEVIDALRAQRPDHHITLLGDQMIAVPAAGRAVVDRYGQRLAEAGDAPAESSLIKRFVQSARAGR